MRTVFHEPYKSSVFLYMNPKTVFVLFEPFSGDSVVWGVVTKMRFSVFYAEVNFTIKTHPDSVFNVIQTILSGWVYSVDVASVRNINHNELP
jgi:hypothetical protein